MISDKTIANAVSGRTARACDCCIRRRARWYCASDDAFLCQTCDRSVHSANRLARKHQRVRLKTASTSLKQPDPIDLPSWQRGLTRKARTPRHGKHPILGGNHQGSKSEECAGQNPLPTVPELGAEDATSCHGDETDDQLLYRVPIFDPFVVELCTSSTSPPLVEVEELGAVKNPDFKSYQNGYHPSDMDLEEFAADVETLLGKGLDEEPHGIEQLGLLNCGNSSKDMDDHIFDHVDPHFDYGKQIKAESDDMVIREPFDLGFEVCGDDFPTTCQDHQEDEKVSKVESSMAQGQRHDLCKIEDDDDNDDDGKDKMVKRRKILLRLDYEAISAAWATQSHGSPWINGQRPEIDPDDCWPHFMGTSETELQRPLFGDHQMGGHGVKGDGGREARVSRYREKRRTRLFSKKIRYEVRKLNAEKRPRMKGRFVKRSSFAPPTATAFPLLAK